MEFIEYLQETTLAKVGYRPLVSVEPTATISQALEAMRATKRGCVLVVEGNQLRGIFTERDALTRVLGKDLSVEPAVSTVMTPNPTTAEENEPLNRVFGKMQAGGFRHLPVVNDDGEALGTVSVNRVVGFIADHFVQAVYTLPPEPHQYPKAAEGA